MLSGFLPVNKPPGMSSFDVIRRFKKFSDFTGKIGHAGTLDVFASGILILMLGKATKHFDEFQQQEKSYRAGVRLGYASSTLDIEGVLTPQEKSQEYPDEERIQFDEIESACQKFIGVSEQTVPDYSAAKQNGQPLYKLARQGKIIEKRSKSITIHDIKIVALTYPLVTLDIRCSSGTYIRQLTFDIFHSLNRESFLYFLQRTQIGEITLDNCAEIEHFHTGKWQDFVLPLRHTADDTRDDREQKTE